MTTKIDAIHLFTSGIKAEKHRRIEDGKIGIVVYGQVKDGVRSVNQLPFADLPDADKAWAAVIASIRRLEDSKAHLRDTSIN